MKKVNEGQTQVYIDGKIEKQYGVSDQDANGHYLQVPQNLKDLIIAFKKSGHDDRKILAILGGMGIDQRTAMSGINFFSAQSNPSYNTCMEQNEKNTNKMNFTVNSIYEDVNTVIDSLNQISQSGHNSSFTAKQALMFLESVKSKYESFVYDESYNTDIINSTKSVINVDESLSTYLMNIQTKSAETIVKLNENLNAQQSKSMFKWVFPMDSTLKEYADIKKQLQQELENKNHTVINQLTEKLNKISHSREWVNTVALDEEIQTLVTNYIKNPVFEAYTMLTGLIKLRENQISFKELNNYLINSSDLDTFITSKISKKFESSKIYEDVKLAYPVLEDDLVYSKIGSIVENRINSDHTSTKFNIISDILSESSKYNWLEPVKKLETDLISLRESNDIRFRVVNVLNQIANKDNVVYNRLRTELSSVLNENDVVTKFKQIAKKNPWSNECKIVLNHINESEHKLNATREATPLRIFSPIVEQADGNYIFHLFGKDYQYTKSGITETKVSDARFRNAIDVLNTAKIDESSLLFFGNNQILDFNLETGDLKLGESLLNDLSITELRNTLIQNRFYGVSEINKVDKIASFFESIDMISEMDNFTALKSNEFLNLYLTLIAVEEGYFVNKVNPGMGLNEMKFIPTATQVVNEVKSFMKYDISNVLQEKLVAENNKTAKVNQTRTELNNRITFLQEQKTEVIKTVEKIGESEELSNVLELIESEIEKFEKELSKTYINEGQKKNKYIRDGYIEAILKRDQNSDFKKGQEVMVDAEIYSSSSEEENITIINPDTGKNEIVQRRFLNVQI